VYSPKDNELKPYIILICRIIHKDSKWLSETVANSRPYQTLESAAEQDKKMFKAVEQ